MAVSEGSERDKTEDWLLAEPARPRSFAELEARIDTAIAVAQASEEAVAEVGASAIEAAAQAGRAAELAESASISAQAARLAVLEGPAAVATMPAAATVIAEPAPAAAEANPAVFPLPRDEDLRLAHFMDRADQVVERLRALERIL